MKTFPHPGELADQFDYIAVYQSVTGVYYFTSSFGDAFCDSAAFSGGFSTFEEAYAAAVSYATLDIVSELRKSGAKI